MSKDAINRRARAGVLIRVFPGVFRDGAVPRSWLQRAMATHLWAGHTSLIAGAAAAALHQLDGFALPSRIEVWSPRPLKPPNPLVIPRRTELVEIHDRAAVGGIAVMEPVRALIDVAGTVSEERLEVALEDLLRRRMATVEQVVDRLGRIPANCRGRQQLITLLTRRGADPPAESGLEVKVIRMLRAEGYPHPIRQRVLNDEGRFIGRVDLVFPERRLILEVDSFRYHSGRASFEGDRSRRNALTALGWTVLHITHLMMKETRPQLLLDIARSYNRPLCA
jgi:very-short-patch-repair endonuclease